MESFDNREEIAIIGMAGRFPGANNIDEFWQNLCDGVESIRPITPEELRAAGVDDATLNDPAFVGAGASMDGVEGFDASFFGIGKREAEIMDPQHRALLETAWAALENAGYDPERFAGPIGVFGGVAPNTYFQKNLLTRPDLLEIMGNYPPMISSEREYALTRIAFKLNLQGPSLSVNTACSTSGVAIHLACQSVLSGECDMALAGGARIRVPLNAGYLYQEDGILSPDGHCRAFDAEAKGTVVANGVAMIVIKRLSDAMRDGDNIYALIKGTAINNDGAAKVGFTAPSVQGQAAVISEAQAIAEVEPETVSYIEAHGTATALGDPIEIAALTKAFREGSDKKGFCAVGSLKTNIGHLDAGAGVAGVIKTALALKNKLLPPSLNYKNPNPQIDFDNSPFFVNNQLVKWPETEYPRRAGVSSFGLGGTNAHIVLEEAPEAEPSAAAKPYQLLLLSAKSEAALDAATVNLAEYLQNQPEHNLADLAYTLQVGRRRFQHRRILVCQDSQDALEAIKQRDPRKVISQFGENTDRPVVFMFPGSGAQYLNMALEIYQLEPFFRELVDKCAELLKPRLNLDLRDLIYPADPANEEIAKLLEQPSLAMSALFTIEYALAKLWMSWGLQPSAVVGHSLGEYTAACLAGVMQLEDALALVAFRGKLFEKLPAGAMLSVPLSENEIRQIMPPELAIAAINKPSLCVVSGPVAVIEEFQRVLSEREIEAKLLHISAAAHSPLVEPILDEFAAFVSKISLQTPELPYVSNVTGAWVNPQEVATADYWVRHLRGTVRFAEGMQELLQSPEQVFLEVGPGQTLSTFVRQHPAKTSKHVVVASLRHPKEQISDRAFFLNSLGRLWLSGVDIDWQSGYQNEHRKRIPLPTYPFERKRYWIDPAASVPSSSPTQTVSTVTSRENNYQEAPKEESTMVTPGQAAAPLPNQRKERIIGQLKDILYDLSGIDPADMGIHATFLELGFDSLLLTQANTAFHKTFAVKISFRQLFEEAPTLHELAAYIDGQLPPEALPEAQEAISATESATEPAAVVPLSSKQGEEVSSQQINSSNPESLGVLERLINQQMQLMSQQLQLLSNSKDQKTTLPLPLNYSAELVTQKQEQVLSKPLAGSEADKSKDSKPQGHGPWKPIEQDVHSGLSEHQRKHLSELIAKYTELTNKSKALTAAQRQRLADPRAITGFRKAWKEMVYQLAVLSSAGSRIWDLDDNEYVDFTMGFGINLFGHSPEFIREAIAEQLEKGIELSVLTPLAQEAADLFCKLTQMERATFVNTGSEAVSAAIRAARTVTMRDKIATFAGDYHGIADEVLVRPVTIGGELRSLPAAPGIPRSLVENVLVLDYEDPNCLEILRRHAHELAAVLVEPVQSRHPDLQLHDMLKSIRQITQESGTALIFDELITGFRLHPRGAQGWYGIDADIVAYGKIISGGLPMAVVAGKSEFLDAFDGGMWSFGDDSFPAAGVTFFGGTFVRHPLSLAASLAVMKQLEKQGSESYEELNRKSNWFAAKINEVLETNQLPVHLEHCASMFFFKFTGDNDFAQLLYYYLRTRGVHVWDRPFFLSFAHSEEDLQFVLAEFKQAVADMQQAGFFPSRPDSYPVEESADYPPTFRVSQQGRKVALTEAQTEIWLASQMGDEASCSYNSSNGMFLSGAELDINVLQRAVKQLVGRHEALRTTFSSDGDYQLIAPEIDIDIPFIDLSKTDESTKAKELEKIYTEEGLETFDLTKGPLFRVRLIKLASEQHLLLLTTHHIICDGLSFRSFHRDLVSLYSSGAVIAPARQFSDYVSWQQEQQNSEDGVAAQAYWLEQFSTPAANLELPYDRPRPPVKTYACSQEEIKLDMATLSTIKKFSAQNGTTIFATFLAAYKVLLQRLSGQNDIIVGVFAAGQSAFGDRNLVGHCVNMLPVRSQLEAEQPFADFLGDMRSKLFDTFDYQNYTFGSLVKQLKLPRDSSRIPLISTTITLETASEGLQFTDQISASAKSIPKIYCTFDLELYLTESKSGLSIVLQYNTDLFDQSTIKRWLNHYRTLLGAVLTEADKPLADLPLLDDIEREKILYSWNNTARTYPQDHCFHQLFEEQAQKTPNAPAVVFEGQSLSYGELNARANQLARHLRLLGVNDETLVGVFMERSLEMVVGLLGIHKAGGAYVPLDPSFPAERLSFMLEDAQVAVLLTQQRLLEEMPEHEAKVLCIDEAWDVISKEKATNLSAQIAAENLAYLIYTSGSTGRPKGVQIPHRALTNFLCTMREVPGISAQDKLLAVTTLSFDISALELFLPLISGACLEIVSHEVAADGMQLRNKLDNTDVTIMQATPSTWRLLLEAGWQGKEHLKMLCGGEALPRTLADKLLTSGASLWNMYGPTETTIWSSVARVEPKEDIVRIGPPIANTQLYVFDDRQRPVPIGVPGELYIGGDGLARGYLNRAELTAERFISNPFSNDSGAKLYRTGDLVRYLPEGDIEFFGRTDHQVKIRGYRIELGEIEVVLRRHPAVKEAVVIAREDKPGDKRLVAYLTTQTSLPTVSELRAFLRKALPDYMVPAAFVTLDAFPLTPNNKIDRRSLPVPDQLRPELQSNFLPPQTENERQLAAIWQEVLNLQRLGVNDNFFELGGDSMLGMQVITKANNAGLRLTPRQLFQYQTIGELAAVANEAITTINAEQGLITGSVPLTPGQSRFLNERQSPDPHHWNISALFKSEYPLRADLLEQTVQHILSHHDALRLRFSNDEPGWQQLNEALDGSIPFASMDISALTTEEQKKVIATKSAELQASLNLADGPMLRVTHFDLGPAKSHRLLVIVHHFVSDAISWNIFWEDFQTVYQQLGRGEKVKLLPKTVSFKRWAECLKSQAQKQEIKETIASWLALPWSEVLPLALDYPEKQAVNNNESARIISVSLSPEQTNTLLYKMPNRTEEVLIAALVKALSDWTAAPATLIDIMGHGRDSLLDHIDLSRTVGFFISYTPLLLKLGKDSLPNEVLALVTEQMEYLHAKGMSFDLLRYLCDDAEIAAKFRSLPRAQVLFNYRSQYSKNPAKSSTFRPAQESRGVGESPRGIRYYPLAINGDVSKERLKLRFVYSKNLHRKTTIENLAHDFMTTLEKLIDQWQDSVILQSEYKP